MSRRPHFHAELRRWMDSRGISSYQKMADDLKAAGYPDKIYRSKIRGYIHRNNAVPGSFFWWLDKTYNLGDEWPMRFARALMADALRRPYRNGREANSPMRYDHPERIERIARHAYQTMYVNTGALLKIDFDKDNVTVAAVSSSGHHSPRYPFSAEAPRVYGDAPVTLDVWREWVKRVIESESEYSSHSTTAA
jgi:hypothetical protein